MAQLCPRVIPHLPQAHEVADEALEAPERIEERQSPQVGGKTDSVGPGDGDAILVQPGGAQPLFAPCATAPVADGGAGC
jgi:hypothetical protein